MNAVIGLREAVNAIIARHGGTRVAARATGVNYAYLSRLARGEKVNPTNETLRKLGLRKVVTYVTIRPKRSVLVFGGQELELKR